MSDTTWVKTSAPIDLTDIRFSFEAEPPYVSLPFIFGYGADPVMLHVDLPLGPTENPCTWEVSLETVIDHFIDTEVATGGVDVDVAQGIGRKIAARLRELADKLDAACEVTA